MKANTIIEMINGRMCDDVLADIYVDKTNFHMKENDI